MQIGQSSSYHTWCVFRADFLSILSMCICIYPIYLSHLHLYISHSALSLSIFLPPIICALKFSCVISSTIFFFFWKSQHPSSLPLSPYLSLTLSILYAYKFTIQFCFILFSVHSSLSVSVCIRVLWHTCVPIFSTSSSSIVALEYICLNACKKRTMIAFANP